MWDIIIPILTFIVGCIAGALITGKLLTKRFLDMQADPKMIQQLAVSMGRKMNIQQATQITNQMKKSAENKLNKKDKKPKN